ARLLRGGNFPLAYAYPKCMRETRDLLRRRTFLVRQRSGLMTHIQILNAQYNLPPLPKKLSFARNRAEMDIPARFADASVRRSASCDLAVIDCLDGQLAELELYLTRTAKVDDVQTYHRLRTIPGVGPVLALILLYEIHDIHRFTSAGQLLSSARLVRCDHESAGKVVGSGGRKIGNAHLRWAFGEAACLFLRASERGKRWKERQARKRGGGKALAGPGGRPGPGGLRPVAQGRGVRRGPLLGRPVQGRQNGFLFSVPEAGELPCRHLTSARPGARSVWPVCSSCWAGRPASGAAFRRAGRAPCTARPRRAAGRSRRTWGVACGSASVAAAKATARARGPGRRGSRCDRRGWACCTRAPR